MNNVNLIGSLIREPELTIDPSGAEACPMQIAVQRRGATGEPQPGVIYIDVTAYGRQARRCAEHLTAGQRIGVIGRLERDDSLDDRGPAAHAGRCTPTKSTSSTWRCRSTRRRQAHDSRRHRPPLSP